MPLNPCFFSLQAGAASIEDRHFIFTKLSGVKRIWIFKCCIRRCGSENVQTAEISMKLLHFDLQFTMNISIASGFQRQVEQHGLSNSSHRAAHLGKITEPSL
jgi:hypothetical protein